MAEYANLLCMTSDKFEKIKREALNNLKAEISRADLSMAWAERRLQISKGYLGTLVSNGGAPSLELALKINELVEELKKLSLVS